jgi:transposase
MEELLRRLLGVKELVVRGAQFESHGVEVEVRPRQRRARSGECGRPSPGYDTSPTRLWRHLSLGRTAFWLRYAPRRVECREHGVKVERVPWAAHGSYFTHEFGEMTAWLAQRMENPWNLTQRQGEKLSEVARTHQHLYRAYLLKESLAKGLDYRQRQRAEQHLDGWTRWASRSKLKPFVKLSRTIRRFKDGILAYVSTGLSNGVVEGVNNKICLLTRRAFGFHSAAALTAMIHLCCGGLSLTPPLPKLA